MKDHRIMTLRRIANALTLVLSGCTSATCPFRTEKESKGKAGTANLCDCIARASMIKAQFDRESAKEGI